MSKISISILLIFILGGIGISARAQNDAADAAAVFRSAKALQARVSGTKDDDLNAALLELKSLVEDGNRHLLNQKVRQAKALAERVSAQMSLVKLLAKLSELKERLHDLRQNVEKMREEKAVLKGKYKRLVLSRDGRAYSGAYPALSPQPGKTP